LTSTELCNQPGLPVGRSFTISFHNRYQVTTFHGPTIDSSLLVVHEEEISTSRPVHLHEDDLIIIVSIIVTLTGDRFHQAVVCGASSTNIHVDSLVIEPTSLPRLGCVEAH
jgi:hypothetical protein